MTKKEHELIQRKILEEKIRELSDHTKVMCWCGTITLGQACATQMLLKNIIDIYNKPPQRKTNKKLTEKKRGTKIRKNKK